MLLDKVKKIDAIVYTHYHFDHIGGFDDIRGFNFIQNQIIPIYLNIESLDALKKTFSYAFGGAVQVGGGLPTAEVHIIDRGKILIGDIELDIIPLMHGKIEVLGFRIGNFAYCTDTNFISEESKDKLRDLDVLILDALRYHPHPTHFTIDEAISIAKELNANETYFTHIAHQVEMDNPFLSKRTQSQPIQLSILALLHHELNYQNILFRKYLLVKLLY